MKSNMISIVNDNLFNFKADALVVPRSTVGTMTKSFKQGLLELGVDVAYQLEYQHLGTVEFQSVSQAHQPDTLVLIYATSVDNDTSSLDFIKDIAKKIALHSKNNPQIRSIALPLLGTGAGGLDHVEVYKIYFETFTTQANTSAHFYIFIPEEAIYEKVRKFVNSIPKITDITATNDTHEQTGYWILKLNPKSWTIDNLFRGTEYSFHATYVNEITKSNEKRVDYDLFHRVKKGDQIIGFAMQGYNCVVCLFDVTKPIDSDDNYGEKISLVLQEVIQPRIPIDAFEDAIGSAIFRINDERTRLIAISQEAFKTILSSRGPLRADNEKILNRTQFIFRDSDVEPVLGVEELADEAAKIIALIASSGQGNMMGIFGRWGRGKSFFIKELWKKLSKNSGYKRVDFHAWKYQDTPANWAYLYEKLSEAYFADAGGWWNRIKCRFLLNWIRLDKWNLFYFIITVVTAAIVSFIIPLRQKIEWLWQTIVWIGGTIVFLKIIYFFYKYGGTAKNLFKEYYSKVSFSKYLGAQAEVQKEVIHLLNAWFKKNKPNKIVLFVEDIDRCPENSVIDIVDSLRIMLEDPQISNKIVIVAAIDERILQTAIQIKYQQLLEFSSDSTATLNELSSEYFDKLFIFGLKLGDLSATERDEYFSELIKNDSQEQTSTPDVVADEDNDSSDRIKTVDQESGNSNTLDGGQKPSPERDNTNSVKDTVKLGDFATNKLHASEIEILRKALGMHWQMTPRQIRIFYYRYLLLKNILVLDYRRAGLSSPWTTFNSGNLMVTLLLEYSQPGKKKQLAEHKLQAIKNETDMMSVHLIPNESIKTIDYCHLLRALDVVVAY